MTYRAIVRDDVGTASHLEDRPDPVPAPGEVVLAPEQVSLCGTDIQILRRLRDDPSPIVGHEGLARVVAVGAGVTTPRVGDRVMVNPTHPDDPSFLLGHNVEGLFQQRVTIAATAVRAGLLVPVADDLDAAVATLVEPLAVTRYALSCLAGAVPATLVVYGDGLIGNLAALVARRCLAAATEVVLLHRTRLGADWSTAHLPEHVRNPLLEAAPPVRGPVAVLVATPRDATVPCLDHALNTYGDDLTAVHLVGGLYPDAATPTLPGVDLNGVRAANTGGPWPPHRIVARRGGRSVALTGNRGVDARQLSAAADELRRDPSPALMLTHKLGLDDGLDVLNRVVTDRTRVVDGALVVRLVIDLAGS